jgi:hypothetical protein
MDTNTVSEIIKMIDNSITNKWKVARDICKTGFPSKEELPDYQYELGGINTLETLREHLQSFVEAKLDAFEVSNSIGE